MIVHNFDPVLIDFGLFQIRWYSVAYILGIVIGWIYATKIIKLTTINKYNFEQIKISHFNDLLIYLVIGIVLGGRLGYVLFYNLEYYSQNFLEIFKIWQGGMSFHGGLLGIIVSISFFAKKTKTNFFKLADIVSCVAPIGIFLGRIANFINGGNLARHPSQIYEAILEGVILFILINYLALKKRLLFKTGYISGLFLVSYSILRIFSEIFREPDIHLGLFFNYFSLGTLLSIATLVAGVVIIISVKKNEQNN